MLSFRLQRVDLQGQLLNPSEAFRRLADSLPDILSRPHSCDGSVLRGSGETGGRGGAAQLSKPNGVPRGAISTAK